MYCVCLNDFCLYSIYMIFNFYCFYVSENNFETFYWIISFLLKKASVFINTNLVNTSFVVNYHLLNIKND